MFPIAAVSVLALSSCGCCTGEERAPKLRPLPAFNDVPTYSEAPVVAPVVSDSAK